MECEYILFTIHIEYTNSNITNLLQLETILKLISVEHGGKV